MSRSKLRQILDEDAGLEELNFTIPHIFLPPRYRKISNGRNMILFLDTDLTVHIRWEGSLVFEHLPLTVGESRRLIRESQRNMAKYRAELYVFSKFIDVNGEVPNDNVHYEFYKAPKSLPDAKPLSESEDSEVAVIAIVEIGSDVGGESPMPSEEEFFNE